MPVELTHASFFSGVGGLDLGLERAGWRTVSFSEIDPYASAVLAQRWPGVPNLGDIVRAAERTRQRERTGLVERGTGVHGGLDGGAGDWRGSTLWSGGFPCQDLSVAGKRRGLAGERSGLAFAFLALVERHRPPAVLLENVPGLLSSHAGRDLGALLGTLGELGYGWAYRVLDARHFGVPQRRRRVFILALHARVDPSGRGPAEVLSVGSRCGWHPPTGVQAGPGVAASPTPGVDIARAVTGTSGKRHDDDTDTLVPTLRVGGRAQGAGSSYDNTPIAVVANAVRASDGHHGHGSPRGDGGDNLILSPAPDPGRDGAADGLARRLDDRGGVAATLNSGGNSGGFRTEPGEHLVAVQPFVKVTRPHGRDGDGERWAEEQTAPTLNDFDLGSDVRSVVNIVGTGEHDDPLLPNGLDSHRYRCCGNGVVSSVSEYIGLRLRAWMEAHA